MEGRCCASSGADAKLQMLRLSLLAASLAAFACAGGSGGHVDAVIKMIKDMEVKCEDAMHKEKLAFVDYQGFCKNAIEAANRSSSHAEMEAEQLKANIGKAESEQKDREDESAELRESIDAWEKEIENATTIRREESFDNKQAIRESKAGIAAVDRALKALEESKKAAKEHLEVAEKAEEERQKAEAEESDSKESEEDQPKESLLQSAVDTLLKEAPSSVGSGNVVSLLDELKRKTKDELLATEQAEGTANKHFEVLKFKLDANIKRAKERISEHQAAKEELIKRIAGWKGDLQMAEGATSESANKIQETRDECMEKAVEYDKNQVTRGKEREALEAARKILEKEVSLVEQKHITVLLQLKQGRGTALSQHFRGARQADETRMQLLELLQQSADATGSKSLALLARHAQSNPLDRIKDMIRDMLFKLQNEQNKELGQKAHCDKEVVTNTHTRTTKSAKVEELSTLIENNLAEIEDMAEDLKELRESVSHSTVELKNATELREKEKAKNKATIAEAEEAQLAVTRAKEVLGSFGRAVLLQDGSDMEMAMDTAAEEPYQGSSRAIVGMLEVIISDFAQLQAETAEDEESAKESFFKYMAETKKDIGVQEAEIDHKEKRTEEMKDETASANKELGLTKTELQAAEEYYAELVPLCINIGPTYEERQARRKAEIEGLKGALDIIGY